MKEKYWHELFEAGLFLKAVNGLWQTISGAVLLYITQLQINHIVSSLTQGEISEDPQDKLVGFFISHLQRMPAGAKNLVGIYILAHGLVNLFLAYNLYKDRLWSYLAALGFGSLFTLYLCYRLLQSKHSYFLPYVIIFEIIFAILTLHEYQYKIKHSKNQLID